MLTLVDAFSELVEDARLRLGRLEGREVSMRDLARRAGVAESRLRYQLKQGEGHTIPRDLIEKLAAVFAPTGIGASDLLRAAQVTAGYQVVEEDVPDVGQMVVRYLSQDLSREERLRTLARLQEILGEEMRRAVDMQNGINNDED